MSNHERDPNITLPLLEAGYAELSTEPAVFHSSVTSSMGRSGIRVRNSLAVSGRSRPYGGEDLAEEGGKKGCCSSFCRLVGDFPVTFVLVSAALGIGLGVGLSFWTPANDAAKENVLLWVGLPGELFIRALRCIILPLVFVSITVSVMDMIALGEAGKIVGYTIGLYVCTTIFASLFGVLSSVIFSRFYNMPDNAGNNDLHPDIRLGCNWDKDGIASYLTETDDGSVICVDKSSDAMENSTLFRMEDVNGYFATNNQAPHGMSLSESVYQGLFMQLIGSNMIGLFIDGNFLGVIVLGAGFGIALSNLSKNRPEGIKWDKILTIQVLEELMHVFMFFIFWIIKFTPFAIVSLIARAVGGSTDLESTVESLGYLFAAVLVGMALQITIVYLGGYALFTRKNPLLYFRQMIPAFSLGFACSSSAATLPVSIDCALGTGQIPEGIARFCLPLGATINMDGSSIGILCECIWMAYYNGITPTVTDYILLVFCSTLGSMGAAPVPQAGLVLILTSYTSVFGSNGETPAGFAYIVAIDWLFDRLFTMQNVCSDLAVTAIISKKVGDDLIDLDLGEKAAEGNATEDE